MEVIAPSFTILTPDPTTFDRGAMLRRIEAAGRTCYKSEHCITDESAEKFVRKLIDSQHESVIEHESVTIRIVCDRGVSHEIVRHRIASYSQESTRYVNYGKRGMTVIDPRGALPSLREERAFHRWLDAMEDAEDAYNELLSLGCTPQEARSVLPNSLKTEIVVTYNLRQWRHFFRMRCAKAAHPQMREIAVPMLREFRQLFSPLFDDVPLPEGVA